MFKRITLILSAAFVLLSAVLLINTLRFRSRQIEVAPATALPQLPDSLAAHLAGALSLPTVSYQDTAHFDPEPFLNFQAYLQEVLPEVHRRMKREIVNRYSLLYTWEGSHPQLPPVVLMAHLDVVPVEPQSEMEWLYPAFSGEVADGYIWGRGALDDKASLMAMLEAAERLLAYQFRPHRTLIFAVGHDEEVGGSGGAAKIVEVLEKRGVRPAAVLDEGGAIIQGMMPGIAHPVAMVGIAEKGYVSLELVVESHGGHSSMPPRETAVGILARAVYRLETHQMPARLEGPIREMFDYLGPEMPLFSRVILANLWLFKPIVLYQLSGNPTTNAMVRTTTAPTMLEGSVKENVLPTRARAVINFRIRPGDTIGTVVAHVRKVIDDPRVRVRTLPFGSEPSPVSSPRAPAFEWIARTIRQVFSETQVTPSLVVGATDSRHFVRLSRNIYRFAPLRLAARDVRRVHGVNERIAVQHYLDAIRFYIQLFKNLDHLQSP